MQNPLEARSSAPEIKQNAGGGPLSGVRVLDLTSVIMGPFATQILGDLGAEIMCIEAAGGDVCRYLGHGSHPDLSGTALNVLRNKRNITLDLKNRSGREAFMRIAASCDILITNLRPGPRERLGITYDDVQKVRQDIIYCHAQGWAIDSVRANAPAYDDVIQSASGLADLFRQQTGRPANAPIAVADQVCSLTMVYSVLAALYHREKTGEGQCIEIPMVDTLAAFMLAMHGHDAIPQPPFGPPGYQRLISPLRSPLPTTDGYLQMVLYTKSDWVKLFTVGGIADAERDERLQTPQNRNKYYPELYQQLADVLKMRSTDNWIAWCETEGIPYSPVVSLQELVEDLPMAAHPAAGNYKQIPIPVRFSKTPGSIRRQAPLIGEHNTEILNEVGYSADEIKGLQETGGLISATQAPK